MPKQEPQRSCLGCRVVRDKKDLLRFVLSPDRELVPDLQGKLPGRGAYTCRDTKCLGTAVERRQFNRAFKGEVVCGTPGEVIGRIRALLEKRIASYLALAKKAGQVTSGGDMVTDTLRKQRAGVVVLACDISPDIGEKLANAARRSGAECYRLLDKEHLGDLLGKELRSVAAIDKGGIAQTVNREMQKYRNFFEGGAQGR
ncbi:DUF448 domain-containing protein [Geobacter sp. DSM 9736]|uniref:DUF448 domain-containing protein n=1 Tax=Geobacter sp. DSM 9736 TaxID=1277350 RepID=UPI000B612EE0|nr:DUF448 domain-containing protein [Geobacter sp. DSM 9736]SNB45659.1 LSU ribosomal protein L7AE [Geobacter sp. DSM 9736]